MNGENDHVFDMPPDACIESGKRGYEHDNGCSGNDAAPAPQMDDLTRLKFRRDVKALLHAHWHTGKIADWACSAASGFGRYWNSREHALCECNAICSEINAVRRAAARNVARVFRAAGL